MEIVDKFENKRIAINSFIIRRNVYLFSIWIRQNLTNHFRFNLAGKARQIKKKEKRNEFDKEININFVPLIELNKLILDF